MTAVDRLPSTGTPTELDPKPYAVYFNGVRSDRSAIYKPRFENGFGEIVTRRFAPRPEFSQDLSAYENGTK